MYQVGDLLIYSTHGICQIDEISERTYSDATKTYYVMHPLNNDKLVINIPIHSDKIQLLDMIGKDEAIKIIETFKEPGIEWFEKNTHRTQKYLEVTNKGDRFGIANIVNTLMRKQHELEQNGKKLPAQDKQLLGTIQSTLFTEISLALNTTSKEIYERVVSNLKVSINSSI